MREENVSITRRLYTFDNINDLYAKDQDSKPPVCSNIKSKVKCDRKSAWVVLTKLFPILKFLRTYKVREYLLGDIVSGLSAGFMHFPQGLGFGLLAGLTPVYGLYTTFFPIIFYTIFGTSQHVSFGTTAVISLLTANILDSEYGETSLTSPSGPYNVSNTTLLSTALNTSINVTTSPGNLEYDDALNILQMKARTASMAAMVAGFLLLGMGILRLGFLTSYMSTSFVGGFTTAAAFHITTSQVSKMLGIHVKSHAGAGKLIKTYIDIFSGISNTNFAALITSILCLIVLLLVKICINEKYKHKLPFPIPIDFVVVVIGTMISHFANFSNNFDVHIVGEIPTGVPAPSIPDLSTANKYAVDAMVIGLLSFAMTISMAKLCCKIHGYDIDDSQELVAYGMCNTLSSFFSAFPSCISPPRAMLLSDMGAKTTANGVSTAALILLVLVVVGQLFESLPVCVLAAMIVASIKDLLLQVKHLPRIWRINKYDFIIWLVTCLISILVDLDIGLAAGIFISVFTVIIQNQNISSHVIGVPEEDIIFIDQSKRQAVQHISGVRMFRFNAALYFATAEQFKKQLYQKCLNPKQTKRRDVPAEDDEEEEKENQITDGISFIVLDCSAFNYLDIAGVGVLQQVVRDYQDIGVSTYFARCPKLFVRTLTLADFFENFPRDHVFHDMHDAITACQLSATKSENGQLAQTDDVSEA